MFKIGDVVMINPNWMLFNKDNRGIYNWRDYIGKIFIVDYIVPSTKSIILKGNYFFWAEYMLMKPSDSIRYLLEK